MSGKDSDDKKRLNLLSLALRAVRKVRPANSRDLAKALGLSLRGYQHFEAGGGQLNIDHVMRFSRALDCDPIGILAAVHIGKPELAAYVAQNKAMIAYMIALQEFVEDTGEAITRLETTTWVSAYRDMFKGLSEKAKAEQTRNDDWLARNTQLLGPPSPPVIGAQTGDDTDALEPENGATEAAPNATSANDPIDENEDKGDDGS